MSPQGCNSPVHNTTTVSAILGLTRFREHCFGPLDVGGNLKGSDDMVDEPTWLFGR
jgi:hypothetical protein